MTKMQFLMTKPQCKLLYTLQKVSLISNNTQQQMEFVAECSAAIAF